MATFRLIHSLVLCSILLAWRKNQLDGIRQSEKDRDILRLRSGISELLYIHLCGSVWKGSDRKFDRNMNRSFDKIVICTAKLKTTYLYSSDVGNNYLEMLIFSCGQRIFIVNKIRNIFLKSLSKEKKRDCAEQKWLISSFYFGFELKRTFTPTSHRFIFFSGRRPKASHFTLIFIPFFYSWYSFSKEKSNHNLCTFTNHWNSFSKPKIMKSNEMFFLRSTVVVGKIMPI